LDLVHMWTTLGAGEHPPRIPRKQNSRQKNDSVKAGGSANVGGQNKKSNSIYVSPSGGGGGGDAASSCLRQGKELREGSLANWRFYRCIECGAFEHRMWFARAQNVVRSSIECGSLEHRMWCVRA
jgi:hypothetical protein